MTNHECKKHLAAFIHVANSAAGILYRDLEQRLEPGVLSDDQVARFKAGIAASAELWQHFIQLSIDIRAEVDAESDGAID